MKTILVLSDTHFITNNAKEVFNNLHNDIDIVIHLGDGYDDMNQFKEMYDHLEFISIVGNCDVYHYNKINEVERMFNISGKNFLAMHGHEAKYEVKYDYEKIVDYALGKKVDICLFGHTHYPIIFEKNGIIFMNPGSISLPRNIGYASYGIVKIDNNNEIQPCVFGKNKNGYTPVINN